MSNKISAGKIELIPFLSWCHNQDIYFANDHATLTLDNLLNALCKRLGTTTPRTDSLVLPVDVFNSTKFKGYRRDCESNEVLITIEFIDDVWMVTESNLPAHDYEFFQPYEVQERKKRIDLDLSEEFIYTLVNIDDQYFMFKGVNIYKDETGYFTTCHQLDHKDLETVATLLNIPMGKTVIEIFNTIINVLCILGSTYNDKLIEFVSKHINKLNDSELAKKVQLHYVGNYRFIGKAHVNYTQLPFNLDYIVSTPMTSDSPIEFIDIKRNISYRIAPDI